MDEEYKDFLKVDKLCYLNNRTRAAVPGSMLKSVFEHSVSTFNSSGINVGGRGR